MSGLSQFANPEEEAGFAQGRRKRDEAKQAARVKAKQVMAAALATCDGEVRAFMAVAFLEFAVDAVGATHDAARLQAFLGKHANRCGGELPGPGRGADRHTYRSAAERLFRPQVIDGGAK